MTRSARYVWMSKPCKGRTCLVALQLADKDPHGLNIQDKDPFLLDGVIVLLNPKEFLQHHLAFTSLIVRICRLIAIERNLYQIHAEQSMHKASLLAALATCPVCSVTK